MNLTSPVDRPRRARALRAWCVHLLTASGACYGLMTIRAVASGDYRQAFLWMLVAVVVDGIDGPLARLADVERALPEIQGAMLDNVIDYLNYVVAPAWLMLHAGIFPPGWDLAAGGILAVASAIGFARVEHKTADHFFTGFPSYWNIVAFYLVSIRPPRGYSLAIVLGLSLLVLVKFRFVYPSRTAGRRRLTLGLTALWLVMLIALLIDYSAQPTALLYASLFYPLYYVAVSIELAYRRRRP